MLRQVGRLAVAVGCVALVTAGYSRWLGVTNPTSVALSFLLIVLIVAASAHLWVAATTSIVAMLCFNFFFLPPVGTWTIADPQNWVALFAFLVVALVASNLSSAVRAKAQEAVERRDAMARLFDLSRDVMLITDGREAFATLVSAIARRFDLGYAAICLPRGDTWDVFESGSLPVEWSRSELSIARAAVEDSVEFDARSGTYEGHRAIGEGEARARLVALRVGTRFIGLLATKGRVVESGTLDALAGVVAIAIERVHFLEERKNAELARQSEELKSALLASLGHDLRTPLTAIRVAASNLRSSSVTDEEREAQSELISVEVERLNRLFQNILDMARLDAGGVAAERRWVQPSDVVDAARAQVEHALRGRRLQVRIADDTLVKLDPRLTAAALAQLLENAAQYSPPSTEIEIDAAVRGEGLTLSVRDHGPGIAPQDLPKLFDRFYRGTTGRTRSSGTGMGLSIARGVLAVEQGRIWAENCEDGGARFTIAVPGEIRAQDGQKAISR